MALVSEQNRATAETSARGAQAEGLEPAKRWAKELVDACVTRFWKWGDVEFVWRDEDPLGPLERARMDKIYLDAGVLTQDEVRARMGLAPLAPANEPVAKYRVDQPRAPKGRSDGGRWIGEGDGEVEVAFHPDSRVLVADSGAILSDAPQEYLPPKTVQVAVVPALPLISEIIAMGAAGAAAYLAAHPELPQQTVDAIRRAFANSDAADDGRKDGSPTDGTSPPAAEARPTEEECAEEWTHAKQYCQNLYNRGLIGRGAYRGLGRTLDECERGMVSEACGGNPVMKKMRSSANEDKESVDAILAEISSRIRRMRANPQAYIAEVTQQISLDNSAAENYRYRAEALVMLERWQEALADLDTYVSMDGRMLGHLERGEVLMQLGRFHDALADFSRAESLDPEEWAGSSRHKLSATCHAYLGDEATALAALARMREERWTPRLGLAPAGTPEEVAAELSRIARTATSR